MTPQPNASRPVLTLVLTVHFTVSESLPLDSDASANLLAGRKKHDIALFVGTGPSAGIGAQQSQLIQANMDVWSSNQFFLHHHLGRHSVVCSKGRDRTLACARGARTYTNARACARAFIHMHARALIHMHARTRALTHSQVLACACARAQSRIFTISKCGSLWGCRHRPAPRQTASTTIAGTVTKCPSASGTPV